MTDFHGRTNEEGGEVQDGSICVDHPTNKNGAIAGFLVLGLVIGGIFWMSSGSGSAGNPQQAEKYLATRTAVTGVTPDQQAVISTVSAMQGIEIEFTDAQDHLKDTFARISKKNKRTNSDMVDLRQSLENIVIATQSLADRAGALKYPVVQNEETRRHLTNAIDAHKKWALSQQAKIAAVSQNNGDLSKEFGLAADNYAGQEAMSLVMAYQSAGIDPSDKK